MSLRRARDGGRRKPAVSDPRAARRLLQWNHHHRPAPRLSTVDCSSHPNPDIRGSITPAASKCSLHYPTCSTCSLLVQPSSNNMTAHLVLLPCDIIILLMQSLSARDLAALRGTCRTLCSAVSPQLTFRVALCLMSVRPGGRFWMEGLSMEEPSAIPQSFEEPPAMEAENTSSVSRPRLLCWSYKLTNVKHLDIMRLQIVIGLDYDSSHVLFRSGGPGGYNHALLSTPPDYCSDVEILYIPTDSALRQNHHHQSGSKGPIPPAFSIPRTTFLL